jgi:hypothetical protein
MTKQVRFPSYIPLWIIGILLAMAPVQVRAQQETPYKADLTRRLAPGLKQNISNKKTTSVRVQVRDKAQFYSWLTSQQLQLDIDYHSTEGNILTITGIDIQKLEKLAASPFVNYIDRADRKAIVETELRDADFAFNNIPAIQQLYPYLTGNGMAVSIKEEAYNENDLDLRGRTIGVTSSSSNYSIHATTMATIIAGAGNTGPQGKGIAGYAKLATASFSNLFPDNSAALLKNGITLQNHSYGVGVENYYGLESQAYDQEVYNNPELLHIFSSGNSGNKALETGTYAGLTGFANLTGQFKTSKNTLSVGALEADNNAGILSSRGPAYDGRIKPELTAYGKGGTSEAAAVVSGIALLVQQAYKNQYNQLPSAALVKAVLINSANDAGRFGVDFKTGYGNADALGAVRTVTEGRFIANTIEQGAEQLQTITIPAGVNQLKATIVWHEQAANPEAKQALVNDLDLQLYHVATGQSWKPWTLSTFAHPDSLILPARRATDRLNNVEQVTIDYPQAGAYQFKVNGYRVTGDAQPYSLAFEFEQGLEWVYPAKQASIISGKITRLRWQGGKPGQEGQLEYKFSGSANWQLIDSNIDLGQSFYDWNVPEAITAAQLRLTTPDGNYTSDEFVLTKQLKLQVGFNCDNEALLHWPALPGVTHYQLYQVGNTHLEPFLTTTDTLAVLQKNQLPASGDYVTVAPFIQGTKAENSVTVAFSQHGLGCYIKSFMPQQLVSDKINLQLDLSTHYQLTAVVLERLQKGTFAAIQTISPVSQLSYTLPDNAPAPGKNTYRIKVTTTGGKHFYSQPEEAIYADKNFLQAYPNPIQAGQTLNIAVAGDVAIIQLYDQLGRLMYETEEYGILKQIPTTGLKGLYLLRVKNEGSSYVMGKVLVL